MAITYITFRRRTPSQGIHRAGFDMGSYKANRLAILEHAHRTNSEIVCSVCHKCESDCLCEPPGDDRLDYDDALLR